MTSVEQALKKSFAYLCPQLTSFRKRKSKAEPEKDDSSEHSASLFFSAREHQMIHPQHFSLYEGQ